MTKTVKEMIHTDWIDIGFLQKNIHQLLICPIWKVIMPF